MGKVQSDKIEKVTSFSCGGVKSLSVGETIKNYESHFKELNMEKFGEFMFGIRFAFEFFGYKAIPDERGKDDDGRCSGTLVRGTSSRSRSGSRRKILQAHTREL